MFVVKKKKTELWSQHTTTVFLVDLFCISPRFVIRYPTTTLNYVSRYHLRTSTNGKKILAKNLTGDFLGESTRFHFLCSASCRSGPFCLFGEIILLQTWEMEGKWKMQMLMEFAKGPHHQMKSKNIALKERSGKSCLKWWTNDKTGTWNTVLKARSGRSGHGSVCEAPGAVAFQQDLTKF